MWRLLLCLLLAPTAHAQPADCDAVPVGPDIRLVPQLPLPRAPRGRVPIDLGEVPMHGTLCQAEPAPEPADILRGEPAPRGLLQGDGPRDVLHNRWQGQVTVHPPR